MNALCQGALVLSPLTSGGYTENRAQCPCAFPPQGKNSRQRIENQTRRVGWCAVENYKPVIHAHR